MLLCTQYYNVTERRWVGRGRGGGQTTERMLRYADGCAIHVHSRRVTFHRSPVRAHRMASHRAMPLRAFVACQQNLERQAAPGPTTRKPRYIQLPGPIAWVGDGGK